MERRLDRPIPSAEKIAFLRALSACDPDERFRNPDSMARFFIGPKWRLLLRFHRFTRRFVFSRCPRTYYYHFVRTKIIDEYLIDEIQNGMKQLVILGAGNDSRAYRFSQHLENVKVFELDFPGTQVLKKSRLLRHISELPRHVAYVPIDFNSQYLLTTLIEHGFDRAQRSLFIMEGLTYFLRKNTIDRIFKCIANHSPDGSTVVFDYILQQYLDDESHDPQSIVQRQYKHGEPLFFGIPDRYTESFVEFQGFRLQSDLGRSELEKKYLAGRIQRKSVGILDCFRIVRAEVHRSEENQLLDYVNTLLREEEIFTPIFMPYSFLTLNKMHMGQPIKHN